MTKAIFAVAINLIYSLGVTGQNVSNDKNRTISFDHIEYVEDVKILNDDIYCLGFSFKEDGYGNYSYLNKYDKKSNLVWSLKIDSTAKNQFNKIGIFDNKIFISGVHGVSTNKTLDVTRYLYSISMNGKILEKVKLGQAVIPATNLEFHNNAVWIAYTEPENIEYGSGTSVCVVASYNLATKKVNTFKGKLPGAYPRKIFVEDSNIFVLGDYTRSYLNRIQEQFIMKVANGKLLEKGIASSKFEWFINSRVDANRIYVYSVFTGVYGDNEKFLKVSSLGVDLKEIETRRILLADLGLTDIKFDSFSNGSDVWVVAENGNGAMYLKLDNSGMPTQKIDLAPIGKYAKPILISPEKQIQILDERTLKITNEHPVIYKGATKTTATLPNSSSGNN